MNGNVRFSDSDIANIMIKNTFTEYDGNLNAAWIQKYFDAIFISKFGTLLV